MSVLADAINAPRLLVGAKEAGAGSLIARLLQTRPAGGMRALLESPANTYFDAYSGSTRDIAPRISRAELDNIAESEIEAFHADYLLLGASAGYSVEKALMNAAERLGIPAISVVDHYWNLWQRFAGDVPHERWRYRPQAIAVPDQWCAERLRKLGCPVKNIVTFKHPLLWQASAPVNPQLRESARQELGFKPETVVVTFVSEYGFPGGEDWHWDQPAEAEIAIAAQGISQIAAETSLSTGRPISVLIRPHPAELRDWQDFADAHENVALGSASRVTKAELFSMSDIAFGLNSMLLAEIGGADIPSYSWFPDGSYDGLRLSQFVPWVKQCDSLADCRRALLSVLK